MKLPLLLAAGASVLVLSACSTDSRNASAGNDPYEETNRSFFASHEALYRNVVRPIAVTYNGTVPEPARDGIHNFLVNINLPVTFGNDLLQGELARGGQTLARFAVNTTVGVGGFIDVARRVGIPEHETDFADTLADYGVGEGPYMVVPVIGPTVPRELAGKVADAAFDPLTYVTYGASLFVDLGRDGTTYLDKRARAVAMTDEIASESPDPYVTTRILYEKHLAEEADHSAPDEDFDTHEEDVQLAIAETKGTTRLASRTADGAVVSMTSTPQDARAYCSSVAADRANDAAANGYAPEDQQAVHDGALADCLNGQTGKGDTANVIVLASSGK